MFTKKFNPVMDAQFVIMDFKAVAMHCLTAGDDDDSSIYDSVNGRKVSSAEFGFRTFIDMYMTNWLDQGFMPWQILACHDNGHAYRTSILPDYKSNRDEDPDNPKKGPELNDQYMKLAGYLQNFLAGIGATQLMVNGVEGDDIVAYLVQKLSPNFPCFVYTVDADLLKLVNENTAVFVRNKPVMASNDSFADIESEVPKNMHNYLLGLCDAEMNFLEGVNQNVFRFLTLFKSLAGDTSDGYKGIKGFGEKKAWKDLVSEFDIDGLEELEEIVSTRNWAELKEAVDEDPDNKLLNLLYDNRMAWRQCWIVAELHPDLCWRPTAKGITKIKWFKRVPNADRVKQVFDACDVTGFYEEHLDELMPQTWLIDADNYDGTEAEEFAQLCKESFVVGWDYETWAEDYENGSFNARSSKPTGVSFCAGSNFQYAFYLTTDHKDSNNLPQSVIKEFIDAIPEDTATVAHNLQFETTVTATNFDILIENGYDTAVMNSYVDENEEAGLKKCSKRELNYTQETYDEVLAKAGAQDMRGVTAEQVMSYGIDDSLVCCHLFVLYWLRMQLEESWEFYADHEPIFTKRMAASHIEGVNVDFDGLTQLHEEDIETIAKNKERLRVILKENCSEATNEHGASQFTESEREFIQLKTKAKYKDSDSGELQKAVANAKKYFASEFELSEKSEALLDAMNEVDDSTKKSEVIRILSDYEVYKFHQRALKGSVYVDYTSNIEAPSVAPTAKNLSEVAEKLGLPPFESVANSRISEWVQEVCDIDFDNDTSNLDDMNDDQRTFIELLQGAVAHFKPKEREHENFQKFNHFCCKVLEKKSKETYSGTELSTGSPIQMQHLFYCMLDLPVRVHSKKQKGSSRDLLGVDGSPSTDAVAVDTAIAEDVAGVDGIEWKEEALNCIKRIKESETRISLYHTPYPKLVNQETGRMHPSIISCGTITRRPTGGSPNILQVSKHQKGGAMRGVFKPVKEGDVIVAIDFAGQELRILASESKDPNMLSAYLGEAQKDRYFETIKNGGTWEISTEEVYGLDDVKDLHSNTASSIMHIFGLDEDGKLVAGGEPVITSHKMTYEEFIEAFTTEGHPLNSLAQKVRKRPAKTTNFLIAYQGTDIALAQKLIIKQKDAEKIMDNTNKLYPFIEKSQIEALQFAKKHGYVETAYGNRRHATNNLFSSNKGEVSRMGRQLFNAKIQGCAADILKVVLKEAEEANVWERCNATLIAPVYDEIVNSVPATKVQEFLDTVVPIMNLLPKGHAVPMMADISLGPDWQKQKEIGSFPTPEEVEEAVQEALEYIATH